MYNLSFGCALMYEIEWQLQFTAGMNKVLWYVMFCYVTGWHSVLIPTPGGGTDGHTRPLPHSQLFTPGCCTMWCWWVGCTLLLFFLCLRTSQCWGQTHVRTGFILVARKLLALSTLCWRNRKHALVQTLCCLSFCPSGSEGMERLSTAFPKRPFRVHWRVGDAMVSRGNAGWTASKSGHPYLCQNHSRWPSAEKTGRGSALNYLSCPQDDPVDQETELTELKWGHAVWCWEASFDYILGGGGRGGG